MKLKTHFFISKLTEKQRRVWSMFIVVVMASFDNGLAEACRPANPDMDYTHGQPRGVGFAALRGRALGSRPYSRHNPQWGLRIDNFSIIPK